MGSILKSREARWAFGWIGLVTLFRLWFVPHLDLVGDEAHYWECGRSLDWNHYGKGPGAAFVIRVFTLLLGDHVWAVRLPAVLLSAGTGWLIFLLGRAFYSERVGLVAVVAASVMPLFAIGSILMTIDPLSVFFWAAAALSFWEAVQGGKKRYWILTGLWIGLGFQAKYTNAAELISFALFLLLVSGRRKLLFSGRMLLLLGTFVLLALPIVFWNAFYGWITAMHLFEGGDLDRGFRVNWGKFAGFWLLQAIVVSPILFFLMLMGAIRPASTRQVGEGEKYLLTLFWPLFVVYGWISLNKTANGNWTAPALLAGLVLGAGWAVQKWSEGRSAWRGVMVAGLLMGFMETALLHDFLPIHFKNNPLDRAKGWNDLAVEAEKVRQEIGADFVVADEYQTASLLSFYLPDRPRAFTPDWPRIMTQYSIWPSYRETYPSGSTGLYVAEQPNPLPPIARDFESVKVVKTYRRSTWGEPTGPTFHFYECLGLKSGQPTTWQDRLASSRKPRTP
jgi:Dolichyl-phosphate-mannose-protein mannosyltransferase